MARRSFWLRCSAAALLVAIADRLFDGVARTGVVASWFGAFALFWIVVVALVRRDVLRRWPSRIALGTAIVYALLLFDSFGFLKWLLFWSALSSAVLLPRAGRFDDAVSWAARLVRHAGAGLVAPLVDLAHVLRVHRRRRRVRRDGRAWPAILALPTVGTIVFVWLFAQANPLIERVFDGFSLQAFFDWLPFGEVVFWFTAALFIWPSLRPARAVTRMAPQGTLDFTMSGVAPLSIVLSLAAFNLVFAIQNGLDLAFLWSGAALPAGITLAEYAHRGAYPLIATALLAGLFVVVLDQASARDRLVRRLVVVWIVQNVFLVASSVLRTCDYIASYSLTPLRIEALLWMTLVATGLLSICWRLLTHRSTRWLINANTFAALLTLTLACGVDLDEIAAWWNVRHAREVGGTGVSLDLCLLSRMGPSALVPLAELERRPLPEPFRAKVEAMRRDIVEGPSGLAESQGDWRTWTWRHARTLARANALLGDRAADPPPRLPYDPCNERDQHDQPTPAPRESTH
jgi:hypothetical protein